MYNQLRVWITSRAIEDRDKLVEEMHDDFAYRQEYLRELNIMHERILEMFGEVVRDRWDREENE